MKPETKVAVAKWAVESVLFLFYLGLNYWLVVGNGWLTWFLSSAEWSGTIAAMRISENRKLFDISDRHLVHVISLKFVSVWTHDQRFATKEQEMIAATEANPIDRRKNVPMRIASGQELYIEWDGFLVQSKSVLDHMVNILHYGLGIKFSNLTSLRTAVMGLSRS